MSAKLNVIQLDKGNLQDIPAMLHRLADKIEAKKHGDVDCLAAVTSTADGDVEVFAFGDLPNLMSTAGLLQFGIVRLTVDDD